MDITIKLEYTVRDLANLCNCTEQTIRNKVKEARQKGMLPSHGKEKQKTILNVQDIAYFLVSYYPKVYHDIRDGIPHHVRKEVDTMVHMPIPTQKGKIQESKRKDGTVYTIRNLPLCYRLDGTTIDYKNKPFKTKAEAEKERTRIIRNRAKGMYKKLGTEELRHEQAPKEPTYYDFCMEYFTSRIDRKEIAYKTGKDYLKIVDTKIKPVFGNIRIDELNGQNLNEFTQSLTTVINKTRTVLKQTLDHLYRLEKTEKKLFDLCVFPKGKTKKHSKQPLTKEELEKFLGYFKGHRLEYAILLMLNTGMREGEALALQWNEIVIHQDNSITVHVNASYGQTEIGYARKATKTKGSKRMIYISPYNNGLTDMLREAKANAKCKWVIPNKDNTAPILPDNFSSRYFRAVGRQVGLTRDISSHVMRHTFTSYSLAQGVKPEDLSKQLGHTTTENIYRRYGKAVKTLEDAYRDIALFD